MRDHPLWPAFIEIAEEQSISLDHEVDWIDNWIMFLAGAEAQEALMIKSYNASQR